MATPKRGGPKARRPEGEKFAPVPVNARPAALAEAQAHLRAFIGAFIAHRAQHRWMYCLLVAPQKAQDQLRHFRLDLDRAHCVELRGAESYPHRLAGVYGNQAGVYFDGGPEALLITAAEAATLAAESDADALLSLVPGKRALCFDHDGVVLACER